MFPSLFRSNVKLLRANFCPGDIELKYANAKFILKIFPRDSFKTSQSQPGEKEIQSLIAFLAAQNVYFSVI